MQNDEVVIESYLKVTSERKKEEILRVGIYGKALQVLFLRCLFCFICVLHLLFYLDQMHLTQ